jgi:hypothetical protein
MSSRAGAALQGMGNIRWLPEKANLILVRAAVGTRVRVMRSESRHTD